MGNKPAIKKIKIKRKRKRIYETGIEEEPKTRTIKKAPSNTKRKTTESKKEKIKTAGVKSDEVKRIEANVIIKNYMLLSMGVCTIPIPLIDIGAVICFQLKMISKLSELYGSNFSESRGKSIIASLIGSIAPLEMSKGIVGILAKAIPSIGTLISIATLSTLAGASTYAVGKVFIQHFESGGTFLDFDPAKVKKYYGEEYLKGKKISSIN